MHVYNNRNVYRAEEKVVCMLSADAILVHRCQEDDVEAFDEIVARYKDGVYNYIWRMISNRDDVEDLTIEVFVRAFSCIKNFRRESNLRTWLYRIATNLCIDKYRRASLEKQFCISLDAEREDDDGPSKPMELPDETYDPQRVFERVELQSEIQRALAALPEKLRAAMILYDIEGMSYEDIAEALECPVGTVKSRLFNARMQLRTLLKPYVEA